MSEIDHIIDYPRSNTMSNASYVLRLSDVIHNARIHYDATSLVLFLLPQEINPYVPIDASLQGPPH
jgi:hypothetical protein